MVATVVAGHRAGDRAPAGQGATPTVSVTTDGSLAAPARTGLDAASGQSEAERTQALRALLAKRRTAVLEHDAATWLATVDPGERGFRDRQRTVFGNLRDVPFADWTYRVTGTGGTLSASRRAELGGPAWVARVLVGHRLRGFDTSPSYAEQYLTVVQRASGWVLAGDTDGGSAPQPWDLGRVRVVRGDHVLVLGTASEGALRDDAAEADRAVQRVGRLWGGSWPRRVVVLAPRTQREFGRLLLRGTSGLSQVAAVTTGDLGGTPAARAREHNDRVVVNPSAFARLGPIGRRVVLTHELTHVAVRASTTSTVPIWLSEGFADYVGYRGTGVSRRAASDDVLALVRAGRGPKALPDAADFDPEQTTIAPSYSAAYLACALLADTYGEQRLVDLYRAAATAPDHGDTHPDQQARGGVPLAGGDQRAPLHHRVGAVPAHPRRVRQAPRSDQGRAARWAPVAVLGVLLVLLMVLAAVLVPWSVLGAGAPTVRPLPLSDFTAGQARPGHRLPRRPAGVDLPAHAAAGSPSWCGSASRVPGRGSSARWGAGCPAAGRCRWWRACWCSAWRRSSWACRAASPPSGCCAGTGSRPSTGAAGWSTSSARGRSPPSSPRSCCCWASRWPAGGGRGGGRPPRSWRRCSPSRGRRCTRCSSSRSPTTSGRSPPDRSARSCCRLADRAGVPIRDVLVADASRRTTAENAYVSGLGGTRRLVVYDTLLRGASPREVEPRRRARARARTPRRRAHRHRPRRGRRRRRAAAARPAAAPALAPRARPTAGRRRARRGPRRR
nr:hypothetical protein [Angustibacter aerolatus]